MRAGLHVVAAAIRGLRERERLSAKVERLRRKLAVERNVNWFAQAIIERERALRIKEFTRAEDLVDQIVAGRLTAAHLRTELAEARDAIESTAECWRTRTEEAEREAARLRTELCARPGRSHMDWEGAP